MKNNEGTWAYPGNIAEEGGLAQCGGEVVILRAVVGLVRGPDYVYFCVTEKGKESSDEIHVYYTPSY